MRHLNILYFKHKTPEANARLLLAFVSIAVLLLVLPWPIALTLLNSVVLIGIPFGYFLVVLLFPALLVALLFWSADRQDAIARHLSEAEND